MRLCQFVAALALLTLACGQSVTVLTPTPASVNKKVHIDTSTPAPTLTAFPATVEQVTVTASLLYVRAAPSTGADVLRALKFGEVVTVGKMVTNDDNPRCKNWYPVPEYSGWICADFVTKGK